MKKDRLLKLASFLESVPRKVFNIGGWRTSEQTKPEGKKEGGCGFAGCAVGWAVHAKLFRGLKFVDDPWSFSGKVVPHYEGYDGYAAAEQLFGIQGYHDEDETDTNAQYLFSPMAYPNADAAPKQVAKRIREFVSSKGVPSGESSP